MAEIFGFEIKRKESRAQQPVSFTQPPTDDGAINIAAAGGSYGQYVDLEGTAKNEAELVTRYRKMALQPEVEVAIDDIVNEAIVNDPQVDVIKINLDRLDATKRVKDAIRAEFDNVYRLLGLNEYAFDLFRKWYVDGRIYFHVMINDTSPGEGIVELRYIDPRKIRKVRELEKVKQGNTVVTRIKNEFYIYNDKGFNSKSTAMPDPVPVGTGGLKISKDSVIHITSGLTDENNKMVLSHLHKAIKPLNQLQVLEDASVIYRISRAPERRIFYIDVGNLPKAKAEQYLADMMTKHKNRLVYDAADGSIRDDRKFMTMLEDFWLPRREGGRGTEITTLPGGSNLGEMEDVEYFKKKLYRSLNVPISRLEPEGGFTLGRATEISRDELKFNRFVGRLRMRFSQILDRALEKQLVLKGVMTLEEWQQFRNFIGYDFNNDNHFTELKNGEILKNRLQTLTEMAPFEGKYFTRKWIQKNVLRFTDQEIDELDTEMEQERSKGEYQDNPMIPGQYPTPPEEPSNSNG